jgi:site-specific recombinase XerD
MLEHFFEKERVASRLRRGVLGGVLDELASHLHNRGHSANVARSYLGAAGHFSHWLGLEKIALQAVNEETVARFLERHPPICECPAPKGMRCHARGALAQLLVVLRARGDLPARTRRLPSPVDRLVMDFDVHLARTCGHAAATRRLHTRYVRQFLASKYGDGQVSLERLRSIDFVEFLSTKGQECKPATLHVVRTALRSFIRFGQLHELCDGGLAEAIPRTAHWRLASLPNILTEEQLCALLGSFDRSTRTGRRDFAMALCLAQLGLRASEVAGLTLDDIDWRAGTLQLGGVKERRTTVLPLPTPVGRAIVAYLRRGRPRARQRHIFVRHALPFGRPLTAEAVRGAIKRAFKRAEISGPSLGTHALRHTAATRMVRGGASLKQVADVLRHRSLNTVMIYAKVDLPRLAEVALPWPEVQR